MWQFCELMFEDLLGAIFDRVFLWICRGRSRIQDRGCRRLFPPEIIRIQNRGCRCLFPEIVFWV